MVSPSVVRGAEADRLSTGPRGHLRCGFCRSSLSLSPSLSLRSPAISRGPCRRSKAKAGVVTRSLGEEERQGEPGAQKERRGGVLEEALSEESASEGRERLFTNISPVYDILNDALSLGLHRRWKRKVVELAECESGDRCLDVCCGSGDLSFLLARKAGPTGSVDALDFSANMLSYAIQRSFKKDLFQYSSTVGSPNDGEEERRGPEKNEREVSAVAAANIQWIHGDALDLPFADNTFDCLTIGYGLRNVKDRNQCLRECHRVLKPGKRAVILDFNSPKPYGRRGLGLRARAISRFRNVCLDMFVVPTATVCGLREEYAYLKPSIKAYPDGRELVQMAQEEVGFEQAEFVEMAVGLMGALVLRK